MNRLHVWQQKISKKDYIYKLQHSTILNFPKLKGISINICANNAVNNVKQILPCLTGLEIIANQKPIIYCSKKSIATFKLRKNSIIGCKLMLRNKNMYDFLDTFIFLSLPKINTLNGFKAIQTKYINFGISNLAVFPQINNNIEYFQNHIGATISIIGTNKKNLGLLFNMHQIPKK